MPTAKRRTAAPAKTRDPKRLARIDRRRAHISAFALETVANGFGDLSVGVDHEKARERRHKPRKTAAV